MQTNEVTSVEQPRKKRISKILLTAVITAVISVFMSFIIFYLIFIGDSKYLKLKQLDFFVNNYFYGKIDTNKINDLIVRGYVSGLEDRFARYYSAEETEARNKDLSGKGQGIGMIVVKHPDSENIFVKNVYDNSPAYLAGIREGDQIVSVDSVSVEEIGYAQAVNAILREVGQDMTLGILRKGETVNVKATCTEFSAQTVFAKMLQNRYGYVQITAFKGETALQFKNSVNQLVSNGVEALIFDLRGNGGGTVDSVCEVLDFICPKGDIITVKYANGKTEVLAESDKEEINLPMVVLTNEQTASAAELFTASLKDFGKGISIGGKTFGKGVMQTTYNFTDGSSVVFTVAEFFPNSGNSFNTLGISPDIEVALSEKELKYQQITPTEKDKVVLSAIEYLTKNEQ